VSNSWPPVTVRRSQFKAPEFGAPPKRKAVVNGSIGSLLAFWNACLDAAKRSTTRTPEGRPALRLHQIPTTECVQIRPR
jgi:hypothetical protein